MTLRIPAKVLLHVWLYDFYDMTLSTGKQWCHMIKRDFSEYRKLTWESYCLGYDCYNNGVFPFKCKMDNSWLCYRLQHEKYGIQG